MIFDLRELKRSGKTSTTFYFEYEAEKGTVDIPLVDIAGPVKVNGEIALTGEDSAVVKGEVSYFLKGCCSRCLEETEREYVVEFFEEVDEEADCAYRVVNDRVDVKKIANDTINMNIPVNILCKEDCKGICPGCGVNLNHAECKCK